MRWGLLVLFVVWAVPGFGTDKNGLYIVIGIGNASCGAYVSAFEKDRRERGSAKYVTSAFSGYQEWIRGYLTAYNAYQYQGSNVAHGTDSEGWERWFYNWCEERPTEKLDALAAFVEARTPDMAIRNMQTWLSELGYDAGPADGFLGPHSRAAIRQFERDHGLKVTGEVTTELFDQIGAEYFAIKRCCISLRMHQRAIFASKCCGDATA